ncbi:MAG: metallophosphoesterase family protein [Planctomycetes bacterium]|nr:metallophosphoesterase family protein [Planctomycetota bacterium]
MSPRRTLPSHARALALALALAICALLGAGAPLLAQELPVDKAALEALTEKAGGKSGLTNLLSLRQVSAAVQNGSGGLAVDFSHVTQLLDGTAVAPDKVYGTAYAGPYPFESKEARFAYKRFRVEASIRAGKGTVGVGSFLSAPTNSEGWRDRGQVALRFILYLENAERDRSLGTYDLNVSFQKTGGGYERKPSLLEGPFVNLVRSDAPSEAVISFVTDEAVRGKVVLVPEGGEAQTFWDEVSAREHEIPVTDLKPGARYTYRVEAGAVVTRDHELRPAPPKGSAPVRFAYFGDTRAGPGGGLVSLMGVNYDTVHRLSSLALRQGAELFIVGGDLVSGYTSVPEDFTTQLHAWKQAMTGFWNERPVYACMGNHEALLRAFEGASVDRWPYDTQSAEAVFASTFVHPRNGPQPSDHQRPTYKENVYSFHHGPVKVIAFNNNYWYSSASEKYGGAPEGYILQDQLDWIVKELDQAEADPTVLYVVLFAQEPIFPNGGHLGDSMWHGGDNRVRAHVFKGGSVLPEEDGMVAVRNKLVRAVAARRKVAAILGADEHAFHRVLIGKDVPIGDIEKDDRNRNGKLDLKAGEKPSPLADLKHAVWYLVCGGGGAPYYSEEETPWNKHWRGKKTPSGLTGFTYSSQENILLFDATEKAISVKVLNLHGETIDEIPDLMADKG